MPQSAFSPRPPQPIEDLVPDMDELGKLLLLVSNNSVVFIFHHSHACTYSVCRFSPPHSVSCHLTPPDGYQRMMHCLTRTSKVWTAPAKVCTPNPSPAKSPPWRRELLKTRTSTLDCVKDPHSAPFEPVFHSITCCFLDSQQMLYFSTLSLLPANTKQQTNKQTCCLENRLKYHKLLSSTSKENGLLRGKYASHDTARSVHETSTYTAPNQVLAAYHCQEHVGSFRSRKLLQIWGPLNGTSYFTHQNDCFSSMLHGVRICFIFRCLAGARGHGDWMQSRFDDCKTRRIH